MNKKIRPIRSYILRQGRLTKHQARGIEELSPKFSIPFQESLVDFSPLFLESNNKIILEIGFGMGDATAQIAKQLFQYNFLAIEVHSPGVGKLLNKIHEQEISNIKIIQHDAVEVLDKMIPNASLDGLHIFFPDPWHKKRHNKRRLIQKEFLDLVALKLKKDAYIHIATDWEDYALWILEVFEDIHEFQIKNKNLTQKPSYRPNTKYENRGLRLGHRVWDIIFLRR